jgi:hypothetical protein
VSGLVATCPFCEEPLDDSRPWQQGFGDLSGAHTECLQTVGDDEEEERRNG